MGKKKKLFPLPTKGKMAAAAGVSVGVTLRGNESATRLGPQRKFSRQIFLVEPVIAADLRIDHLHPKV